MNPNLSVSKLYISILNFPLKESLIGRFWIMINYQLSETLEIQGKFGPKTENNLSKFRDQK